MKEHGDKVGAEDKAKIETALSDLKAVLKEGNVDTIKDKTKTLAEASMKLGEAIYKTQQEETKPEGQPKEDDKKEDVVDAEYEEVDNKKAG